MSTFSSTDGHLRFERFSFFAFQDIMLRFQREGTDILQGPVFSASPEYKLLQFWCLKNIGDKSVFELFFQKISPNRWILFLFVFHFWEIVQDPGNSHFRPEKKPPHNREMGSKNRSPLVVQYDWFTHSQAKSFQSDYHIKLNNEPKIFPKIYIRERIVIRKFFSI